MTRRPCSGCGQYGCDGVECYLADPIPADEETISTLTLADLRELYGNPFGTEVHGDPLLKRRKAA